MILINTDILLIQQIKRCNFEQTMVHCIFFLASSYTLIGYVKQALKSDWLFCLEFISYWLGKDAT